MSPVAIVTSSLPFPPQHCKDHPGPLCRQVTTLVDTGVPATWVFSRGVCLCVFWCLTDCASLRGFGYILDMLGSGKGRKYYVCMCVCLCVYIHT